MTSIDEYRQPYQQHLALLLCAFTAAYWQLYINQHGWHFNSIYRPIGWALLGFAIGHFVTLSPIKWPSRGFRPTYWMMVILLFWVLPVTVWNFLIIGALHYSIQTKWLRLYSPLTLGIASLYSGEAIPLSGALLLLIPLCFIKQPSNNRMQASKAINRTASIFGGAICGLIFSVIATHTWETMTPTRMDIFLVLAFLSAIFGIAHHWFKTNWYAIISTLLWILLGWFSVQNFSPLHQSIGFISVLSILILGIAPTPYSFLGLGIGLLSFDLFSHRFDVTNGLLAYAVLWSGFSQQRQLPIIGAIFFLGIWVTDRGPQNNTSPASAWITTNESVSSQVIWNKSGQYFIEKMTQPADQMSQYVKSTSRPHIYFESIDITRTIEANKNNLTFGTILQQWHSKAEQIAILSDISGQVNKQFTQTQTQIHIQTPLAELTQTLASLYPDLQSAWLQPNRLIHRASPSEMLHTLKDVDAIIEVAYQPWENTLSSGLTPQYLQTVKSALSPDGTYSILMHLNTFPEEAMTIITQRIEDTFSHHIYILPPDNIDSILVMAQNQPFDFTEIRRRFGDDGYTVLGRTITNHFPKIRVEHHSISPRDWPSTPFTHLTVLSDTTETPADIWSNLTTEDISKLSIEIEHHKEYLNIIEDGVQGNIQRLQNHTLPNELQQSLIAPHIQAAKRHIVKAQSEGQGSSEWAQAQRYALTAQLIAPTEYEPWLLLGEIALGEGLLEKASEKFMHVYQQDPASLPAINGLARIAGLQENFALTKERLIEAQSVAPADWTTHYNLAVFYQEHDNIENAFPLLTKALELPDGDNPKTRIAMVEYFIARERWTRALLEVDRLIQQAPSQNAQLWFLRGRIHFGLEIFDKAENDFRKATLADPNFHAARGSIGVIKMIQGDLEGAAQAFRATLRFDPNNEAARKNLQVVQEQMAQNPPTPQ